MIKDKKSSIVANKHYGMFAVFVNDNTVYNVDKVGRWFVDMIADRLKAARTEAKHTQESLAELIDVDLKQIWRWENGKNNPDVDTVARIAEALNVSTDYLLGLTDDPTPRNMANVSLSASERAALAAWRKGNTVEAIHIISGDSLKKIAMTN